MRQWLAIAGLGVGLFTVAVIVTLAVQGRLDERGTRGIPVLQGMFAGSPEPERDGAPEVHVPAAPLGETAKPSTTESNTGALPVLDLPVLEGGLTVADLETILQSVERRDRLSREREAAVAQRERELVLRQQDLMDREAAVAEQMLVVDRARERLDARIAALERDVLVVQRDDVRALRDYADTLASLEPERAAAVLEREWADDAGRARVTKALSLLDAADVGPILEGLPPDRTREVLLERLKVVQQTENP